MEERLERLLKGLSSKDDIIVEINKNLSQSTTFGLVASGCLITVKSVEAVSCLVKFLIKNKIDYQLIGLGANTILPTKLNFVLIKLALPFNQKTPLDVKQKTFTFPASVTLSALTSYAMKYNLRGWEVFTGIPATLGGAVVMNAGTTEGEFGSLVSQIEVVDVAGECVCRKCDENSFSYRKNNILKEGDIILNVSVINRGQDNNISSKIKELLNQKKANQPINKRTCGCVFKNYKNDKMVYSVGKYIDLAGLKGLKVGDLVVSRKHGNFIENSGNSSYEEFVNLVTIILTELKLHYGVEFEHEVVVE